MLMDEKTNRRPDGDMRFSSSVQSNFLRNHRELLLNLPRPSIVRAMTVEMLAFNTHKAPSAGVYHILQRLSWATHTDSI